MRGQTHEFYNLGDARRARADNLTIRYRKNQIDVRFSSHVEKKQEKPLGRGHLNFRIASIKGYQNRISLARSLSTWGLASLETVPLYHSTNE